ncbi:MAG: AhpC/TSA family protein [Flavobacteriales bacterium]|nr:AhpC/TSA family protein [Flavobacteriales bacterium]
MKKIVLLLAFFTIFLSCQEKKEINFQISGTANNFNEGKAIYLERQKNLSLETVDTAYIEKGKFEFTGDETLPDLYFLRIEGMGDKIPVIVEKGNIQIELNKDSIFASKVSGTYNNEELHSYKTGAIAKKRKELNTVNYLFSKASRDNDQASAQKYSDEYYKIDKEILDLNFNYVKNHPNSFISVLVLSDIIHKSDVDLQQVMKYFNGLSSELKHTVKGKSITDAYENLTRVEVRKKAPFFTGATPDGKALSLTDVKGKVTLIDFWASWCGPCRKESPYLVKTYNDFKDKGLSIISISLDENKDNWKEAITTDHLNWHHVSNLKGWNEPIAQLYNVKGIPAAFLMDENGVIVAKDLRQKDLYNKIAELLKKED